MVLSRKVKNFSILLHKGNVPGIAKKRVSGTKEGAALRADELADNLRKSLTKSQMDDGWWYEVRPDPYVVVNIPPQGGSGGRGGHRDNGRH